VDSTVFLFPKGKAASPEVRAATFAAAIPPAKRFPGNLSLILDTIYGTVNQKRK